MLGKASVADIFDLSGVAIIDSDGKSYSESDARLDREYDVWVADYCKHHHINRNPHFWPIDDEFTALAKLKEELDGGRPTAEELERQMNILLEASNKAVEERKGEYRIILENLYSQLLKLPPNEKTKFCSLTRSIKRQENALSKALKSESEKLFQQIDAMREPEEGPDERRAALNSRAARLRATLRDMGARDEIIDGQFRKFGLM